LDSNDFKHKKQEGIMQKLFFLILLVAFALGSCNRISDKPVSEKLNTDELSKAIKSDTLFADFYEYIRKIVDFYEHTRKEVDDMSDIKKATCNDITYRRLFKYFKYLQDTTYWKPLHEKWKTEWESEYGQYMTKADSVLNYWKQYLAENSLDKYVKVELAQIDKEYHDYTGELKEVNLGFLLTPLQGTIETIIFKYRYETKIDGDSKYYKGNCISTSPFSSSTVIYGGVSYLDRDDFEGKNVETFLRDYNLYIKITDIRKDGVNISADDFYIPEVIYDYFDYGENDDFMRNFYKENVIKELINKDYLQEWQFSNEKEVELWEKKDKRCFDFLTGFLKYM
jgi:hypothetical protein